eukprot:NODE_39_length_29903_cov_0.529057.p18 type:complete len:129 gc:universal NODE_39_length_29903_cov_0.529057:20330-20716(+)
MPCKPKSVIFPRHIKNPRDANTDSSGGLVKFIYSTVRTLITINNAPIKLEYLVSRNTSPSVFSCIAINKRSIIMLTAKQVAITIPMKYDSYKYPCINVVRNKTRDIIKFPSKRFMLWLSYKCATYIFI